jgi:HD superfamily phosphodiesterase
MNFDEQKLVEVIRPYFYSARAGDWEHANRVVKWAKELGKNRDDLYLLITAAYVHDIGWSGVAPKGKLDLTEMMKL